MLDSAPAAAMVRPPRVLPDRFDFAALAEAQEEAALREAREALILCERALKWGMSPDGIGVVQDQARARVDHFIIASQLMLALAAVDPARLRELLRAAA